MGERMAGGGCVGATIRIRLPVMLVLLLFSHSMQPFMTANDLIEPKINQHVSRYQPTNTSDGLDITDLSLISIPYNETFTEGTLTITPEWVAAQDINTAWGLDSAAGWVGTHNGTSGIGHGGQLSLATNQSLMSITDFESVTLTPVNWRGTGTGHIVWIVEDGSSYVSQGLLDAPQNASHGTTFLSTRGEGNVSSSLSTCIVSAPYRLPDFVNNYSLTFDHWLSFDETDAAWMEYRNSTGGWTLAIPNDEYTHTNGLSQPTSAFWASTSNGWRTEIFPLDGYVSPNDTHIEFRFCFVTSADDAVRNGWFIDNLVLHNQGDEPGAWFHGNSTGDYANNADGILLVPFNATNLSGPFELEFYANWDLEGSFSDNMQTSLSLDNGVTWNLLSGIPGLPGNGFNYQGNFIMDESNGWIPLQYALPSNLSSHPNASQALIKFTVQTNQATGYGGTTSSGWEGVFVDNVGFYSGFGTSNEMYHPITNFTTQPSGQAGDLNGWADDVNSTLNEWEWNETFGMHAPSTVTDSFERHYTTPLGWSIQGQGESNEVWNIGMLGNTSGYGPGVFHSGNQGAAVNLTNRYHAQMYTHLTTPEYWIPENATARLTFRQWVCTEANWDGGAISLSTDGGDTWWYIPPDVGGLHDQLSTANSFSPFYGEGIIDGSTVINGCNGQNVRPFELQTYELENLTGLTVRARYSFFSDTFVEADGWYIDDAGIEIDVFETAGSWISEPIAPHPVYGYHWVDGWYEQPNGTTILVDVLDDELKLIAGYSNLTLPFQIGLSPDFTDNISLRVKMTTNDALVTPLIHSLNHGSRVFLSEPSLRLNSTIAPFIERTQEGYVKALSSFTTDLDFMTTCVHSGIETMVVGQNITFDTGQMSLDSASYLPISNGVTWLNYSYGSDRDFVFKPSISVAYGTVFDRARIDFRCLEPTYQPHLAVGDPSNTVFDWNTSVFFSSFGFTMSPTQALMNGQPYTFDGEHSPSFNVNNSTVSVSHQVWSNSHFNFDAESVLEVLVTNVTRTGYLIHEAHQIVISSEGGLLRIPIIDACASYNFIKNHSTQLNEYECSFTFELNGTADVELVGFQRLPDYQSHVIDLDLIQINGAKNDLWSGQFREIISIPVFVDTQRGGLKLDVNLTTSPMLHDEIHPPSMTRWLPETRLTLTTEHTRTNPLDLLEDAPDFESIRLAIGTSYEPSDIFISVMVDQLDSTPRFRQLKGTGMAMIDATQSSVSCTVNACTVDWVLTSSWLNEDADDLVYFAWGQDVEGLESGPATLTRKTNFNEIENDLEIIQVTVVDAAGKRIDDFSDPFWPYHFPSEAELTVNGLVRFEGIPEGWVDAGDAEISVRLQATPPKNLTGGIDEWPSTPIEYERIWRVEVDSESHFSVNITLPEASAIPSNTWLSIHPSISRRGPIGVNSTTSFDRTSLMNEVRFLFDTELPSIRSIGIREAGTVVPADGHVWMMGQDVPIVLTINDTEGLASPIEVWTWLEQRDDINRNGLMEAAEYQQQSVSVNHGSMFAEVELPTMAWTDIVSPSGDVGLASLVIKGVDRAGNPLTGGGDFGADTDIATFSVQRRFDTVVNLESIALDHVNGTLFAGELHTFSFDVTDGNGLDSLESIHLGLTGRTSLDTCYIEFQPRSSAVNSNESCFIGSPTVEIAYQDGRQSGTVFFRFRLDWTAAITFATGGKPSLMFFDEGHDLGLGLGRIAQHEWTPSSKIEMRWLAISDMDAPYGKYQNESLWVHRNDTVQHQVGFYHQSTHRLAQYLPDIGFLRIRLSDSLRNTSSVHAINASGIQDFEVFLDDALLYDGEAIIQAELVGFQRYGVTPIAYNISFDVLSPTLSKDPGAFETIRNDQIRQTNVRLIVRDDGRMLDDTLQLHFVYYRLGERLDSSYGIQQIPLVAQESNLFIFEGPVDLTPMGNTLLSRSDVLVIWAEGYDISGRPLIGAGTIDEPFEVILDWYEFDPIFTEIQAQPYRAQLGDNISIYARVANNGKLSGQVTINVREADGVMIAQETYELEPGEWVNMVWTYEAWKTGRLGLTIEIENVTGRIPIPLANVGERIDEDTSSSMTVLSLSILTLVICFSILFIVMRQKSERRMVSQRFYVRSVLSRTLPPPRPGSLQNVQQEE